MTLLLRLVLTVALALGGAATAVAGIAVHSEPWGWPLAVLAPTAAALALPRGWWSRLPWCVAWSGVVLTSASSRPEGDYVISADVSGYGLLAVALAGLVLGLVGLTPRRARADTGREPTGP
ncbi:MAG: hypothetical protein ABIQ15_15690 [Nocardioides sp.]